MIWGIVFGLLAALMNSVGYLFGARFLSVYHSPLRLLVMSHFGMMLLAIPAVLCCFPFGTLNAPADFWTSVGTWLAVFLTAQACFFISLRFFEASKLSSLLGMKIIVLALIFISAPGTLLNLQQWCAVFLAAAAGVMINWSGNSDRRQTVGWIFVVGTLICYSVGDLSECRMVHLLMASGCSNFRSSLAVTGIAYLLAGIILLPFFFRLRPTRKQLTAAAPYAGLWLLSQLFLYLAFALLLPVFANVILATRGLFSVLLGALLPLLGLGKYDSVLTVKQWLQRGVAAALMLLAIIIYSLPEAGIRW